MRLGNIILAVISIVIGLVVLLLTKDFPKEVSNAPGPGFYPTIIAYLLIVLALFLAIQSIFGKRQQQSVLALTSIQAIFVYKMITVVVVYVILLPLLGFLISTISLLLVLSLLMGIRSVKILFAMPLSVTAILYVIFDMVFKIPLPSLSLF